VETVCRQVSDVGLASIIGHAMLGYCAKAEFKCCWSGSHYLSAYLGLGGASASPAVAIKAEFFLQLSQLDRRELQFSLQTKGRDAKQVCKVASLLSRQTQQRQS
jgi:hypothetical protein